jgi:hypothetical protein
VRRSDPGVSGSKQHAEADSLPSLEELTDDDGLPLVDVELARELGGDIAGLYAAFLVPDRNCIRIVLVVGLPNERDVPARGKCLVLHVVEAIRHAGHLDDQDAWVLESNKLVRGGVAQPEPVTGSLQPETEPRGQNSSNRRTAATTRSLDGM